VNPLSPVSAPEVQGDARSNRGQNSEISPRFLCPPRTFEPCFDQLLCDQVHSDGICFVQRIAYDWRHRIGSSDAVHEGAHQQDLQGWQKALRRSKPKPPACPSKIDVGQHVDEGKSGPSFLIERRDDSLNESGGRARVLRYPLRNEQIKREIN
jgi:hypothetical protein